MLIIGAFFVLNTILLAWCIGFHQIYEKINDAFKVQEQERAQEIERPKIIQTFQPNHSN